MGRLATYTPDDAPASVHRGKSVKPRQTGKDDVFQHISAQASINHHFFAEGFHTEVTSNLKECSFVSSWSKLRKEFISIIYLILWIIAY